MVKHVGEGRQVRFTSASDESFGLHTLLGQRITRSDQTSDANTVAARYWLYGVVEPATGEDFFYSFSHLDAVGFGRFLELFSAAFPDSFNLLHLDQASAHVATSLKWPEKVIAIFQPSHSRELNPLERLWEELKRAFTGKNFDSFTALQKAVFRKVNSLTKATVRSLTGWPDLVAAKRQLQKVQSF